MFSKILQISQQHASRQHLLQRQVGESLRDGIFRRERSQEKQIFRRWRTRTRPTTGSSNSDLTNGQIVIKS